MYYLTLKDTVRIKKARHCCRVIEITGDISMDVPPIMAYMLSLCTGMTDADTIARCVAITWQLTQEKALDYVKQFADSLAPFLYVREDPEFVQHRYHQEDFAYRTEPLPDDMHWDSPANVTLVLTHNCNFKCIYCYNGSGEAPARMLSTEQWIEAVDQLLAQGVTKFTLTGGEPMLHPGFFAILQRIIDGDGLAYVCTNGSLLDQTAVDCLVQLKQPVVQISLDSAIAKVHHELTSSHDSFDKVIDAIKRLVQAGIQVNIKGLVMPHTWHDVLKLIRLCDDLGAYVLVLDSYDICSLGRGEPDFLITEGIADEVEKMIAEVEEHLHIRLKFIRPKRRWQGREDVVICGALTDGLTILPDGEYTLCEKTAGNPCWQFGYFPALPIKEFWNSPAVHEKMHPQPAAYEEPCKSCELLDYCSSGCYASKQFVTTKPYAADPYCWKSCYENNPF